MDSSIAIGRKEDLRFRLFVLRNDSLDAFSRRHDYITSRANFLQSEAAWIYLIKVTAACIRGVR